MDDGTNAEDIFLNAEPVTLEDPEATEQPEAAQEAVEADDDATEVAEVEEVAEAAADDATDESDEVFTVKIDGEETDVPLSELLSGYQRNKDYTQKTQALSQERREFETQRSGDIEQLQAALTYYAVPKSGAPQIADYVGREKEFVQAHGEWQEQEERQAQAASLLEQITTAETARTMAKARDQLIENVPEWSDPAKFEADMAGLGKAAIEHWNFTADELQSATDPRMFLMLRDAVKGREVSQKPVIMARKTSVKPKLGAGSTVKQDAAGKRHAAAVAQLRKTGEVDDPAAIFFND